MVFLAEQHIPIPTKDILSWTFDNVPYDRDEPIIIDTARPERSISNNQAKNIVRKLVAGFRKWGVRAGKKNVVCLHSFNDIMYSVLFLGVVGAGGIFAATNPSYTPYELVHHIKTADVKYLITEPEMLQPILEAAKECNIPNSRILIFDVQGQAIPEGFSTYETLLDCGEEDWVRFDDLQTAKATEAVRLFSSGTTGLPKATMTSHYNLVAEHHLIYDPDVRAKEYRIKRLNCLPMFHAAVFPVAHTTSLKDGQLSYVMRRFELEGYLANIEKYQITDMGTVPPMILAIVMSDLTENYSLKSVRQASCGAAPLGKGPQKRLQDLLADGAPCTQVWGEEFTI
ncbi:MAG: hypothetical protein Q9191_005461 [Dirinaria sp. TL-2023a]